MVGCECPWCTKTWLYTTDLQPAAAAAEEEEKEEEESV